MSPRTSAHPDRILPGDHTAMTAPQKRTHYAAGCRHDDCRAARADWDAQKKRMRAEFAAKSASNSAPSTEPTSSPTQTDTPAPPTEPSATPAAPTPAPPTTSTSMPALGATRRLQGLVFAGHSPVDIASATRISVDEIWWLLLGQYQTVTDTTHRIIDREFKRLRQTGPEPRTSSAAEKRARIDRAQNLAATQGWAGPYDWEWIDTDDHPKHHGTPGAGTKTRTTPTPEPLAAPSEDAPTPPTDLNAPKPAQPSATALAAVKQLRALANAAEAAADALAQGA